MKALLAVLRAAVLAGLFEGALIAAHLWRAEEGPPRGPIDALLEAAGVAGLHVVVWLALGFVLLSLTREPFSLLRGVLTIWAFAAFAARRLVAGGAGAAPNPLLVVVLIVLWLTPRTWWRTLRPSYRLALAVSAVLAISLYSLWGRAPDFRYDLATLGWLYLGSAAGAIALTAALFRWPRTMVAALVALAAGTTAWIQLAEKIDTGRPSVLFILVDTARRDHVAPFGHLVQTPAIERLASKGVLFSDAVTVVPKTPQSVASFLTGRYPSHHGLRALRDHLSRSQPNLVRAFQEAGYPTTALVNNRWLSPTRGFDNGFDRFYETDEVREDFGSGRRFVVWDVLYDQIIRKRREWRPRAQRGVVVARAEDLTDAAIRVLEKQREPFFLYVHYFQPHWPYMPAPLFQERHGAPPPEESVVNFVEDSGLSWGQLVFQNPLSEAVNEGARRLYRGEMDETMTEVGRLLEALERSAFGDDTIVVFTADHGHALGEHEYYFHHGAFLYEQSIRIPLILSWPGHLPAGRVVEHQVRSIDVAPTLLGLTGVRLEASFDGRSLEECWTGNDGGHRPAFLESDVRMLVANLRREVPGVLGKLRGWRDGRRKLILTPAINGPRFELYDLAEDPIESRDLSTREDQSSVFQALLQELVAALPEDERGALSPIDVSEESLAAPPETDISEGDLELLRQLGYVE